MHSSLPRIFISPRTLICSGFLPTKFTVMPAGRTNVEKLNTPLVIVWSWPSSVFVRGIVVPPSVLHSHWSLPRSRPLSWSNSPRTPSPPILANVTLLALQLPAEATLSSVVSLAKSSTTVRSWTPMFSVTKVSVCGQASTPARSSALAVTRISTQWLPGSSSWGWNVTTVSCRAGSTSTRGWPANSTASELPRQTNTPEPGDVSWVFFTKKRMGLFSSVAPMNGAGSRISLKRSTMTVSVGAEVVFAGVTSLACGQASLRSMMPRVTCRLQVIEPPSRSPRVDRTTLTSLPDGRCRL
ncbi:MAG: hypothetical protein ACYTGW_17815 [Planctomycetota bacterium]